jgi:hypothetical protein
VAFSAPAGAQTRSRILRSTRSVHRGRSLETLSAAMKLSILTVCLAVEAVLGSYIGSYFLCVSPVRVGFTRGDKVAVAPAYRYVPEWLDAPAFYQPVHLLDEKYLRRSKWQTRPGEEWRINRWRCWTASGVVFRSIHECPMRSPDSRPPEE